MVPALSEAFAASAVEAAAAVSAYAVAYGVMLLVWGPLGDHFGKRRMITLSCALCAVTTACAGMAPTLHALVLARAASGAVAAAIVPLTVAWIGDNVPLGGRQQALARYSGFTVVGIVLGPLLGGLLTQFVGWRLAFGLLAVVFGALTVPLMRSPHAPGDTAEAPAQPTYLVRLGALARLPWTSLVLAGAFLECALGISAVAFLPTVLNLEFGLSPLQGGAIAALFGAGGFLFSRCAPFLLKRLSVAAMPAAAGALMALGMCLLALMPHWSWALPACVLAGFGFYAVHNTLQSRATLLMPASTGLAVSMFSVAIFAGQSVGVSIAAYTFTHFAPAWTYGAFAAGLLALGLVLRHALSRTPQPVAEAAPQERAW
jgi:YNFM family putative membrane transporter